MNPGVFTALTRRASLLSLGTAALVAVAQPLALSARKKRRKKRNKGDANQLCKKQVGQCLDVFNTFCEDDPECLAEADRCCPFTADCDFAGFLFCLDDSAAAQDRIGTQLMP